MCSWCLEDIHALKQEQPVTEARRKEIDKAIQALTKQYNEWLTRKHRRR